MSDTSKALLLVADISGYTRFLRLHAIATSHASQIIARLLKALIAGARPPLQVAELEGDAVFFYAFAPPGQDIQHIAENVKKQVLRLFVVFNREVRMLKEMRACVCEACVNVDQLKLKQVVHAGEVAVQRIDRFEKLFGLDVVVVHRMLKNSVPSNEYVMMTTPVHRVFDPFCDQAPERRIEAFEGVGEVETMVYYITPLLASLPEADEPVAPTAAEVLGWKIKMHVRTILDLLGLRKKTTAPPAALVGNQL